MVTEAVTEARLPHIPSYVTKAVTEARLHTSYSTETMSPTVAAVVKTTVAQRSNYSGLSAYAVTAAVTKSQL